MSFKGLVAIELRTGLCQVWSEPDTGSSRLWSEAGAGATKGVVVWVSGGYEAALEAVAAAQIRKLDAELAWFSGRSKEEILNALERVKRAPENKGVAYPSFACLHTPPVAPQTLLRSGEVFWLHSFTHKGLRGICVSMTREPPKLGTFTVDSLALPIARRRVPLRFAEYVVEKGYFWTYGQDTEHQDLISLYDTVEAELQVRYGATPSGSAVIVRSELSQPQDYTVWTLGAFCDNDKVDLYRRGPTLTQSAIRVKIEHCLLWPVQDVAPQEVRLVSTTSPLFLKDDLAVYKDGSLGVWRVLVAYDAALDVIHDRTGVIRTVPKEQVRHATVEEVAAFQEEAKRSMATTTNKTGPEDYSVDDDKEPSRLDVAKGQVKSIANAAALGAGLAALDQGGELLLDAAKHFAPSIPVLEKMLADPDGRELAKIIMALLFHTAAAHSELLPKRSAITRVAELQISLSSYKLIGPRLGDLRKLALALADIGEQLPAEFATPRLLEGEEKVETIGTARERVASR